MCYYMTLCALDSIMNQLLWLRYYIHVYGPYVFYEWPNFSVTNPWIHVQTYLCTFFQYCLDPLAFVIVVEPKASDLFARVLSRSMYVYTDTQGCKDVLIHVYIQYTPHFPIRVRDVGASRSGRKLRNNIRRTKNQKEIYKLKHIRKIGNESNNSDEKNDNRITLSMHSRSGCIYVCLARKICSI